MVLHLWNGVISDSHFENNLKAWPDLNEAAEKHGLTLLVENVVCHQDPMSHWVELYRDDEGYAMKTWKNRAVRGYNKYVNDGYDLALIYKSADQPELVLQDIDTADSWNRIASSDVSETPFVKIFTWEDIAAACANVEDMDNLYISATNSDLTAYGLYAIPRAKAAPTKGDVDADGTVAVVDVVALQRYLLMVGTLNDAAQADMNEDGVVDVFDLALLKRAVLK